MSSVIVVEQDTDVVEVETSSDVVEVITGGQPGPPGPTGPQGPPGAATTPVIVLTQAEYDALTPPDADSLYVIIG